MLHSMEYVNFDQIFQRVEFRGCPEYREFSLLYQDCGKGTGRDALSIEQVAQTTVSLYVGKAIQIYDRFTPLNQFVAKRALKLGAPWPVYHYSKWGWQITRHRRGKLILSRGLMNLSRNESFWLSEMGIKPTQYKGTISDAHFSKWNLILCKQI